MNKLCHITATTILHQPHFKGLHPQEPQTITAKLISNTGKCFQDILLHFPLISSNISSSRRRRKKERHDFPTPPKLEWWLINIEQRTHFIPSEPSTKLLSPSSTYNTNIWFPPFWPTIYLLSRHKMAESAKNSADFGIYWTKYLFLW